MTSSTCLSNCVFQYDDVHETTPHSHVSNPAAVEAEKTKTAMKDQIQTTKSRPAQVVATAMLAAATETRLELGKTENIKRALRRQKRAALPEEPATLNDLHVTGEWATTGGQKSEPFLIHDSGSDRTNRILVFASEQQLRHLAVADTWFMDGTFSVAPALFTQVYVIRAPLGQSAVTCVYAFMTCKSQQLYSELLEAVTLQTQKLGFTSDPTRVICDFEQSVISAVATVLPRAQVQGCFYHLCQSTWRKVQQLGLSTVYKENEDVQLFCGMLDGLAFLPVTDVAAGMKYVQESIPDVPPTDKDKLLDLINYFDITYVSGSVQKIRRPGADLTMRLRRNPPLYPVERWNVHDATLTDGIRTNNQCESWNNGFRTIVGHSHPSVWTAIEGFQMDHAAASTALTLFARGQAPDKRQRRNTVKLHERLYNLCCRKRDGSLTIAEMLRGVGHTIRLM